MKLYATITSERESRAGKKGGNEYVQIELSAFGKVIGHVVLETCEDAIGTSIPYRLKFAPHRDAREWMILRAGHKSDNFIPNIRA